MSSSATLRTQDFQFCMEQNRQLYDKLEISEKSRDSAVTLAEDWAAKLASINEAIADARNRKQKLSAESEQLQNELLMKSEHVKLLADQNAGQLNVLEQYEAGVTACVTRNLEVQDVISDLKQSEATLTIERNTIQERVNKSVDVTTDLCIQVNAVRAELNSVRQEYSSTEAQVSLDLEAMQQALSVIRSRNVDYVQTLAQSESRLSELEGIILSEGSELQVLTKKRAAAQEAAVAGTSARDEFGSIRAELLKQIERESAELQINKALLADLERERERLLDDRRSQDLSMRDSAEKAYSLMDTLRSLEVEDRKQAAENVGLEKRLRNAEKITANLSAKLAIELEGKQQCEEATATAASDADGLKRASRRAEEDIAGSQRMAEKRGKETGLLQTQNNQLWHQHAFFKAKVETAEDERESISADLKAKTERLARLNAEIDETQRSLDLAVSEEREAKTHLSGLKEQYDYVNRLVKPRKFEGGEGSGIQIASSDPALLNRLAINDFLLTAQKSNQPIPLMIEKIAELLAALANSQSAADMGLNALSKSNAAVSQLRQMNVSLLEKRSGLRGGRAAVVEKFLMNQLEQLRPNLAGQPGVEWPSERITLNFDGLWIDDTQLAELLNVIRRFGVEGMIASLSFSGNCLTDDALASVLQALVCFPYLKKLDLKKNHFTEPIARNLESQLRGVEGVTNVVAIRTDGRKDGASSGSAMLFGYIFEVRSGPQVRLLVDMSEQQRKALVPVQQSAPVIDGNLSAADEFLKTRAGLLPKTLERGTRTPVRVQTPTGKNKPTQFSTPQRAATPGSSAYASSSRPTNRPQWSKISPASGSSTSRKDHEI